jgi:hypothetical protein
MPDFDPASRISSKYLLDSLSTLLKVVSLSNHGFRRNDNSLRDNLKLFCTLRRGFSTIPERDTNQMDRLSEERALLFLNPKFMREK